MKKLCKTYLAIIPALVLLGGCSAPSSQSSITPKPTDTAPSFQGESYDLKELDVQPKPRNRVQPIYPLALKKAGVGGEVLLGAILNAEGVPTQIHVIQASHPAFRDAAVEALKKWRWKPGQKGGHPVACKIEQPFSFAVTNY